ncbi:MAG: hypothetical protein AAB560_00235 [Patescibacteria group bacterium]
MPFFLKIILALVVLLSAITGGFFVYKAKQTPAPQSMEQKDTSQQSSNGKEPVVSKEKLKPPFGTLIPIFEPSVMNYYLPNDRIAGFKIERPAEEIKKFYFDYFAANLAGKGWKQETFAVATIETIKWRLRLSENLNEYVGIKIEERGAFNRMSISYGCSAGSGGSAGTSNKCPGLQGGE